MRHTTVDQLAAGMVMTLPESGLGPSVIVEISQPIGASRLIRVTDLATGELRSETLSLGTHRRVVVHDVLVEHHRYVNKSGQQQHITLGRTTYDVAPGEAVHFTGKADPELFDPGVWDHSSEPVDVATETRPL